MVKIVARSNGNSNLRARPPKRKLKEKKKGKPEKHHMHRAAPALFAPTSEAVVHVVIRRRLHQLKALCQLKEPFNAGDRVQLHRRWRIRAFTCDERNASSLAPLSLHLKRVAAASRQDRRQGRAASNQTRLVKSERRVAINPATGHSSGNPVQARARCVELTLLKAPMRDSGRLHIPITAVVCQRELPPPEPIGNHEDGENATPRILQYLVVIREDVCDEHQQSTLLMSPEERPSDQPTWPPTDKVWWRAKKCCSVTAERN